MRLATVIPTIVFLVLLTSQASSRTWNIYADGSGDAATIEAGLDSASYGDSVVVSCGTYYESDLRIKPGVTLTSESGTSGCATIDAQGGGRVLYCSNADNSTWISGFTITNGLAKGEHDSTRQGAGIYIIDSEVTIERCSFLGNVAFRGGGFFTGGDSDPVFTNCDFRNNQASSIGGGGYAKGTSPSFSGCAFVNNSAQFGGGIYCSNESYPTFDNSRMSRNSATSGGAVFCSEGGPSFQFCVFDWNSAYSGGAFYCGADSPVHISNGTLVFNDAYNGSALLSDYAGPTIEQSIVALNTHGPAIECFATSGLRKPRISCSNISNNDYGNWGECVENQATIDGNFSLNPYFCGASSGDLNLRSDSPCLPGNHPDEMDCDLIGAFGVGCEAPTAVKNLSWGGVKRLFR